MHNEIDVFSGALALLALTLVIHLERRMARLEGAAEQLTGEGLPALGRFSRPHRIFTVAIVLGYVLLFLVVGFSLYENLASR